jgi:hypothetical protein
LVAVEEFQMGVVDVEGGKDDDLRSGDGPQLMANISYVVLTPTAVGQHPHEKTSRHVAAGIFA